MSFEENEISKNSKGGTESVKRELASRLSPELIDNFQVICSRVREIDESKIRIYWLHDLPEDPECNHLKDINSRSRFHKLVFCGNWQYNRYRDLLGVPYDDNSMVIETPINTFTYEEIAKPTDVINLIYTSTPQRGLDVLVPVFERLAETHKNIHLHVFSSFKIYGWDEADTQFEPLYDRIRNHPQMTYHGFASNEVVREHVAKSHIFAYPSTWLECNSRSLIEAMSAKALCVHPNYGGLIDTSGGITFQYQGSQDKQKHAQMFYHAVDHAVKIVNNEDIQTYLKVQKAFADTRFAWPKIEAQWKDLMEGLMARYPDPKLRGLPKAPSFVYDTMSAFQR